MLLQNHGILQSGQGGESFPTDGLISYYNLNNNVNDSHGLINLTFPANSYNPNGINGASALIPNSWSDTPQGLSSNFNFTNTDPFSYSFWYKNVSLPNNKGFIDKHANQLGAGYSLYSWFDNISISIRGANNTNIAKSNATGSLPTDTTIWHHIVWTVDGSQTAAGTLIYYDGIELVMSTGSDTLNDNIQNPNQIRLGVWKTDTLQGLMDEVSVWNKALTQTDVDFLYNNGSGNFLP